MRARLQDVFTARRRRVTGSGREIQTKGSLFRILARPRLPDTARPSWFPPRLNLTRPSDVGPLKNVPARFRVASTTESLTTATTATTARHAPTCVQEALSVPSSRCMHSRLQVVQRQPRLHVILPTEHVSRLRVPSRQFVPVGGRGFALTPITHRDLMRRPAAIC